MIWIYEIIIFVGLQIINCLMFNYRSILRRISTSLGTLREWRIAKLQMITSAVCETSWANHIDSSRVTPQNVTGTQTELRPAHARETLKTRKRWKQCVKLSGTDKLGCEIVTVCTARYITGEPTNRTIKVFLTPCLVICSTCLTPRDVDSRECIKYKCDQFNCT